MREYLNFTNSSQILDELRSTCAEMRRLIGNNHPQALIGYFWAQVALSLMGRHEESKDGANFPIIADTEKHIIFAMEYIHASIAVDGTLEKPGRFKEEEAQEILNLSGKAIELCFNYSIAASVGNSAAPSVDSRMLAHQILTNWVMVRGRRFQVMEKEFFSYVLEPHSDALESTYGIGSENLARQIQIISDAARSGFELARRRMMTLFQENNEGEDSGEVNISDATQKLMATRVDLSKEVKDIYDDMFNGGLFNLTKHSKLPEALLSDISFNPGENKEFDDGSDISGTPFMTLPARIRPLVKLEDGYYCTEPNFIRDSMYRSLQRSLILRNPEYRQSWNRNQKRMSEDAFADLMSNHLAGAKVYKDVFYPIGNKQWAETDCVILIGDVLINIEAKAGAEALAAPAANLDNHIRAIEKLVRDAYRQNSRFIEYIYSMPEAPIYEHLGDGKYKKVAEVKSRNLRKVFPIGLTVEAFTPFSASIKERPDIVPICGKHSFISLSIDDLMSIRRILKSTGEFLHYLDVRQALASIKNVALFDEMDHLGSYLSQNRVDQKVKELLAENNVSYMMIDGMDQDFISPYFADPNWPDSPVPSQDYPCIILNILKELERSGCEAWLEADSYLRDLSSDARENVAASFDKAFEILREKPVTFFAIGGDKVDADNEISVFGLARGASEETPDFLLKKAEALAIAFKVNRIRLFEISVKPDKKIYWSRMKWIISPSVIRRDYPELLSEGRRLQLKMKSYK